MNNEPSRQVPPYGSPENSSGRSTVQNGAQNNQPVNPSVTALEREKKKRRSKPLLVIILTLLIATLGGIATIAVYKYYFENSGNRQVPVGGSSVDSSELSAAKVIGLIKSEMTGESTTDDTAVPPAVKIAGKSFYSQFAPTNPAVVDVAELVPSTQADVERANLVKFMKDQGFEERKLVSSTPETQQASEFTHKDVMCALNHVMTLNNDAADHSISVACADMSAYKKLADLHQPLLKAYESGSNPSTDADILATGEPKIVDSSTPGYKTATLAMSGYAYNYAPAVGGFQGLFYQSPDGVWHFFKETQNDVACSEYNTVELKKAYAGMKCGSGDEKVAAPTA